MSAVPTIIIAEAPHMISPESPLGAALRGAKPGDTVTYEAPNGSLSVTVLKVESA